MRVTGHQPTFLPYLGFWSKAAASDVFVLLPGYQFTYNSSEAFVHRCLVGRDDDHRKYWTVPILRPKWPLAIDEVRVRREMMARRWRVLEGRYSSAPFWKELSPRLREAWERTLALHELNVELIRWVAGVLGLRTRFVVRPGVPPGEDATERIRSFCREHGASAFVAGQGGRRYMDVSKMGIPVLFNEPILPAPYKTVSVLVPLLERGPEWTADVVNASVNLTRCQ